uniref:Uncharacterized protein n=1 Tax=Rhizophora mucronata TaxID=61149 RepID=A0A2P2LQF8_RHIMU
MRWTSHFIIAVTLCYPFYGCKTLPLNFLVFLAIRPKKVSRDCNCKRRELQKHNYG